MKGGEYYNKFNLGVQQEGVLERPVVPSGGDWQMDTFSSQRDDEDGEEEKKNDRSLGLLCQKFLMLLLVLPVCVCVGVGVGVGVWVCFSLF